MRIGAVRDMLALIVLGLVTMVTTFGTAPSIAHAQGCPPRPVCGVASGAALGVGGSFGNAGFSAGYSMQLSRASWGGGGWCGQPRYASGCGPRWCSPCSPWGGWSFGWPGCGIGGWYGGSRFFGSQTLVIGGPGTFFSGAVVPWGMPWGYGGYPANWLPGCAVTPFGISCSPYATLLPAGFGPQFGPAGVLPFLGWSARHQSGRAPLGGPAQQVARGAGMPTQLATLNGPSRVGTRRASAEVGRRRAAGLVASGDRQVREAEGDVTALRAALASYNRAAASDRECPDTFIRQAIVHAALGDRAASDTAIAKAVALDGRLGGVAGAVDVDPVFGGGGRATGWSPLAARGHALIAEMGGPQGASADLTWLARHWSARWIDGLGGLAAAAP